MEKSLKFLDTHREGTFATSEGEQPRVRIFQIMKRVGTTLYFATGKQKHVYNELLANPHIEFLSVSGNEFVRVCGQARFDVNDEVQREIYADNPVLPRIYADYQDLAYFSVPIEALEYFDLTPTPPVSRYFRLTP